MKYNKNIFCEKPLTLSFKQSKKLYKLAKIKKVKLYVDDIQTFYQKKIVFKKNNFVERKKKGVGDPKNLLYRFAYHDFYFLENKLKSKIKSIIIKDVKKNLKFQINYYNSLSFNFDYSLNSEKRVQSTKLFIGPPNKFPLSSLTCSIASSYLSVPDAFNPPGSKNSDH